MAALMMTSITLSAEPAIPYEIIKRDELGSIKLSLDIRVPLVDGRLPNEAELASISEHLVNTSKPHDRTFVTLEVGAGAYATAHHNPTLQVQVMDFMLMQYPQYLELLEQ